MVIECRYRDAGWVLIVTCATSPSEVLYVRCISSAAVPVSTFSASASSSDAEIAEIS
jgi:hypothetical protein